MGSMILPSGRSDVQETGARSQATASSADKAKGKGSDDVEKPSRIRIKLTEAGWYKDIKPETSSKEILDILGFSNDKLQKRPRAIDRMFDFPKQEAVLFFEELHLRNIREHERKLLTFSLGGKLDGEDLHQVLHDYRQALDDFESVNRLSASALSKHGGLAEWLQGNKISIVSVNRQRSEIKLAQVYLSMVAYVSIQLSFAILGGLFLIVPLVIMVYVPGRTASVVTTCISVFVFALELATWSSIARFVELTGSPILRIVGLAGVNLGSFEPKDIVAATAAYAAVLVVFVGTSISPGH